MLLDIADVGLVSYRPVGEAGGVEASSSNFATARSPSPGLHESLAGGERCQVNWLPGPRAIGSVARGELPGVVVPGAPIAGSISLPAVSAAA